MVRDRFHARDACTYMVMRIINYTNVCVAQCDYCAFYRLPGQAGGYVMEPGGRCSPSWMSCWRWGGSGGVQWRLQSGICR